MTDQDLDRWTAEWQRGTPPAADLAGMARRERRLLLAWIAIDWITGAAGLVFAGWLWLAVGTPATRFAAAGIVALIIVALAFTIANWRGVLAVDRDNNLDFLALAMARCRARLRYIRFGWKLLLADLVVIAGAILLEVRDEGPVRLLGVVLMAAAATAAAAGILWWWGGRERRRMERLAAMQKALGAEQEPDHE
jgi:hypothetical protein